MEKQEKKITLQFSLSKKVFLVISSILIFALLVVFLFVNGTIAKWQEKYNRASLAVTVKNIENQEILPDATFKVKNLTVKSDKNGQVLADNLTAGQIQVTVSKEGFKDYRSTISLLRGKNQLPDILLTSRSLEQVTYSGSLKDKINQTPLDEAMIVVENLTAKTDSEGKFVIDDIAIGKHSFSISKNGYEELKQEIEITKDLKEGEFALMPDKQVYFLSNRDGKKGIYSSDLAAKNQIRAVPASEAGEEDELSIAPNYQFAFFTSYREGIKDENGNKLKLGYILNFSDNSLTRISTDRFPYNIVWSRDSRFFAYEAQKDESGESKRNVLAVYDLSKKENKIIWSAFGDAIDKSFVQDDKLLASLSKWGNQNPENVLSGLVLFDIATGKSSQVILDSPYSFTEDLPNEKLYFRISRDSLKYEYDIDKLEIKEIKEIPDDLNNYQYSPDGRQMIFIETRDGKTDVYLKTAKGGEAKRLTTSGTASSPQWISSNYLVYIEQRVGETALYVVSPAGGQGQKITDITLSSSGYRNF